MNINNNIPENYPLLKEEKELFINLFKRWAYSYKKNIDNMHFTSRDEIYKIIKKEFKETGNWRRRTHKREQNKNSLMNLKSTGLSPYPHE